MGKITINGGAYNRQNLLKKDKDYLVDQCLGLKKRVEILEQRLEAGQHETVVIGLPPLKEMEEEILEALENLDIIVHADKPMIGNRFATASAIYKVFKNKID